MAYLRFEALKKLNERTGVAVSSPSPKVSDFFGENVFGSEQMRGSLSPAVYKKVISAIKNHEKIDETTADAARAPSGLRNRWSHGEISARADDCPMTIPAMPVTTMRTGAMENSV